MAKQTLQTIQEQIAKLQAKAEALKEKNKKPTIDAIVRAMEENDITLDDLRAAMGPTRGRPRSGNGRRGAKSGSGKRGAVAIKYRNPETDETWTGRGRTPRWLAEAEAAGKSREDFAV